MSKYKNRYVALLLLLPLKDRVVNARESSMRDLIWWSSNPCRAKSFRILQITASTSNTQVLRCLLLRPTRWSRYDYSLTAICGMKGLILMLNLIF